MKSIYIGLVCGIIMSVVINTTIILTFFYESSVYLISAPLLGVIICFSTKTDKWKSYLVSILFMLIAFLSVTFTLDYFGVVMLFHQIKYGSGVEMSNGTGLIAVMIYLFSLVCSVLGIIASGFISARRIKNAKPTI